MDLHPGSERRRVLISSQTHLDPIRRDLLESEDWYRDLVEHSQDLLGVHDLSGRLLSVNPLPARTLGYSVEKLLQIPMRELVAPEFRSQFDDYLAEIEREGKASGFLALMTRTGERRIWRYHNTLRLEGHGSPMVRCIAHDVTEQRRAEKLLRAASRSMLSDLRENESSMQKLKLFRALVDQSNDSIEVIDPESLGFLDVNEKACSVLGYSREELLSMTVFDIDPMVTPASVVAFRERLQKSGSLVRRSLHRRKDGSTFPVEVSIRMVHIERDYAVAVARDLTDRQRVEEALRKSEDKFSRAFHRIPMALTLTSVKDHRYLEVNETFERVTGWRREEVLGKTPFDIELFTRPADGLELERGLLDDGRLRNVETTFRMKDGTKRVGLITAEKIELNGEPYVIGVTADITERKQAEEALHRSELNYRMFVSQSSEGIFREDLDQPLPIDLPEDELVQHILQDSFLAHCNEAMVKMYGFEGLDQILGRRLSEMVPPEDPHNIALTREYIRSGFRVIDKESHEIDVHGNPKVFLNSMIGTVENGKLLHTWGIQRDVTEKVKLEEARIQAEEALRENVARLQVVTEELREAKEKLSEEKIYLEQAIDTELGFGEIIGHGSALKNAMDDVGKVAPSDATVLLLGETGTGKELMARALHRLSKRKDNSFIKLNCAAIPSGLLESELFGHEKGAFTGAITKKLGRLELADGGTLFLDEIGDIPLELQPKLLRVLQDQEFERLGGTQTLHVNFRLIAATNRDLLQSVNQRTFRSDLYYRLNVFPIRLPALRDRREDIPQLVEHFVRKCAARMNKSISSIPARTMETLVQWAWPGNIRELENFVERSVILTPGKVLQVPVSELIAAGNTGLTLRDKERERILRALRECKGQLGGPRGAAARLGLKRTTLQSKLTLFGIDAKVFRR